MGKVLSFSNRFQTKTLRPFDKDIGKTCESNFSDQPGAEVAEVIVFPGVRYSKSNTNNIKDAKLRKAKSNQMAQFKPDIF